MIDTPDITPAEFGQFQRLIHRLAGISLADTKVVLLAGRLGKRLKHHGLSTYTEYYRLVSADGADAERQVMVDLLTTNETYFFREEKHFEFLANTIVAQHPPGKSFDVWSAASSTGEEIYTISMVLADRLGVGAAWTVTGSDISRTVLATAEKGLYSLERTRGLPPSYLRKYCLRGVDENEGLFLIAPELRAHTRFLPVNLIEPLRGLAKYDVIFLRNVMIYFDNETKRQVVERLVGQLNPRGYLIIGHAESLNGVTDCVKMVQPTIYRRV